MAKKKKDNDIVMDIIKIAAQAVIAIVTTIIVSKPIGKK